MKISRHRLERILDSGLPFFGGGGTYRKRMAALILRSEPRVGGFRRTLETFAEARRQALVDDIRELYESDSQPQSSRPKRWHFLWEQLSQFDGLRHSRSRGRSKEPVMMTLTASGPYRALFAGLKRRRGNWKHPKPISGLRVSPLQTRWLSPQRMEIRHSAGRDIPRILRHLSRLWDRVLTDPSKTAKLRNLAEFEWWFFAANPTGRCGASLGDCLSLNLRLHSGLPVRTRFEHLDWRALCSTLDEYSSVSVHQSKGTSR